MTVSMHPHAQRTGLQISTQKFLITKLNYKYSTALFIRSLCVWCALTYKDELVPVHPIFRPIATWQMSDAWQVNTASYLLFANSIIRTQFLNDLQLVVNFASRREREMKSQNVLLPPVSPTKCTCSIRNILLPKCETKQLNLDIVP